MTLKKFLHSYICTSVGIGGGVFSEIIKFGREDNGQIGGGGHNRK